jgi:two-component system, chemotaxis family, sensor kinase CheA
MSLDEIDEDDITAFLVESYENLNSIEQDIIDLEKTSTNGEILERIYRAIHSIKGNCGFLPFAKLEAIAHTTENILGSLRDGKLKPNSSIISALLESVDTIRQLLTNIETSSTEGDIDCSTLIKTLAQLGAGDLGLGARGRIRGQGDKGTRGQGDKESHLRAGVEEFEQSGVTRGSIQTPPLSSLQPPASSPSTSLQPPAPNPSASLQPPASSPSTSLQQKRLNLLTVSPVV